MFAGDIFHNNNVNFKNSTDTFHKNTDLRKQISIEKAKESLSLFTYMTGESEEFFNAYLKQAYDHDDHFVKALLYLNKKRKSTIRIYNNAEDKIVYHDTSLPEYKKALKEFYLSVKKSDNVLSAFLGTYIIDHYVIGISFGMNKNIDVRKLTDKILPVFLSSLMEKDYCYAYIVAAKYAKGIDSLKYVKESKHCKFQNKIPKFLKTELSINIAKYDAYQKLLKQAEEKRKEKIKLQKEIEKAEGKLK